MADPKYNSFDDLPDWVKSNIRRFRPNDAETSVFDPVPALGNMSVMELMNQGEDGENRIRRYISDVIGKFFSHD